MTQTNMSYFEKEDVLHLAISDGPEAASVEFAPNIMVELNAKGDLVDCFFVPIPAINKHTFGQSTSE